MWNPFGAKLASKLSKLRSAESLLLSLSPNFHNGESSTDASVEIEPFDTLIPRSAVPVVDDKDRLYPENSKESFIIHGIHVQNTASPMQNSSAVSPPLVLLHGYMNGAAYYYRNLVGLSECFPSIYSLDILGWGMSSRPKFDLQQSKLPDDEEDEETSSVRLAEDFFVQSLEEWRKANNIDLMILCGHSMGGYISVAYCERYPQHVERLVLISPVAVPKDELEKRKDRLEQARASSFLFRMVSSIWFVLFSWNVTVGDVLRKLSTRRGRGLVSRYVNHRLPAIADEEEKDALIDYLYFNSILPGSGEYCVNRLLTSFATGVRPAEDRIPKLQVKSVAFLYGVHDWMEVSGGVNVQGACSERGVEDETPTVDVYQVRNAGHLLMLENWREFNAALILAAGGQVPSGLPIPLRL